MNRLSFTVVALATLSCRKPEAAPAPAAASSEPAAEAAPAKAGAMDLTAKGLPIVLDVPGCVKVSAPMVKIADNAKDLMLACDAEGLTPAFAIQVGLAKGKIWKKEMEADLNFKRWVRAEKDFLLREMTSYSTSNQDFAYRAKVAGTEYMCFSQFTTDDQKLLASMIAACRSMRAP